METLSYPVANIRISDGWQEHIDRGSAGGIDHPVPMFTPVYATHDGFLSVDNSMAGSGGRVATIQGGGITTQMLHLSGFFVGNGNVKRGDLIARSGASAFSSEYGTGGPHVHWHAIIDGIRRNPLNYLSANPNAVMAGNGDDDMALSKEDKEWLDGRFALITAQYDNEISGIKSLLGYTDEIEGGATSVQGKLDMLLAWNGGGLDRKDNASSIRGLVTKLAEKFDIPTK